MTNVKFVDCAIEVKRFPDGTYALDYLRERFGKTNILVQGSRWFFFGQSLEPGKDCEFRWRHGGFIEIV